MTGITRIKSLTAKVKNITVPDDYGNPCVIEATFLDVLYDTVDAQGEVIGGPYTKEIMVDNSKAAARVRKLNEYAAGKLDDILTTGQMLDKLVRKRLKEDYQS